MHARCIQHFPATTNNPPHRIHISINNIIVIIMIIIIISNNFASTQLAHSLLAAVT